MKKLLIVLAIGAFAACNNAGDSKAAGDSTAAKDSSAKMSDSSGKMTDTANKMAADTAAKKDTTTKK